MKRNCFDWLKGITISIENIRRLRDHRPDDISMFLKYTRK